MRWVKVGVMHGAMEGVVGCRVQRGPSCVIPLWSVGSLGCKRIIDRVVLASEIIIVVAPLSVIVVASMAVVVTVMTVITVVVTVMVATDVIVVVVIVVVVAVMAVVVMASMIKRFCCRHNGNKEATQVLPVNDTAVDVLTFCTAEPRFVPICMTVERETL